MENSNKRDYDKEPLIINDYYSNEINKYIMYSAIPILVISAIISPLTNTNIDRYFKILVYGAIVLIALILYLIKGSKQSRLDNDFFKFTNLNIAYINKNKQIKNLQTNQISKLVLSFDRRYSGKYKASKFFTIYAILFLIIWSSLIIFLYGILVLIFAILFVYCILFGSKPLFHIHKGGFKSLRFFDQLVIYESEFKGGKIINILIATTDEYNELRKYFLQILNIDIDKIPRTFSVFGK